MWGQIVMRDLLGGPIPAAKLNQASTSAIAACDAADGVVDGIIDDPRTCRFSAKANVCGEPTAPAANCLTLQEADAIDRIWDGPRNTSGNKIWFGLDRGTSLPALNGTNPFALGVTQFHWDMHDRNFDWRTVSADEYAEVAQEGSRNIADVTDTFGNLDAFRAHGGKLLTLVGMNDQLIMPRGVLHYYRQMASRYSNHGQPDFKRCKASTACSAFPAPGIAAYRTRCPLWSTGWRTALRRSKSSTRPARVRESPVPVSADRDLQRRGQHRRRREFLLRR